MPCPHNEITIVQRSQRQSAVAAAAYQSGEKLFCEYAVSYTHLDVYKRQTIWSMKKQIFRTGCFWDLSRQMCIRDSFCSVCGGRDRTREYPCSDNGRT